MKKIVVIGGGTGTYTVLSGLKKYDLDITAIVTVADSGGSTGRLRDEFGYLPVGDLRMALVALADANGDGDILRDLFLYRFNKGTGLNGHNFGNLFLTALSELYDSEEKAYELASKILRVKGAVLPITHDSVTLIAEYDDGSLLVGEKHIDDPPKGHNKNSKIINLRGQPNAKISAKARDSILNADLIVLGPGDIYTSILANFIVGGTAEALRESRAKVVYIANMINKHGQTTDFKLSDYLRALSTFAQRSPDVVLLNSSKLPKDILINYAKEDGFPVYDDLSRHENFEIIRKDFLAPEQIVKDSGDVLKRSLIRHDSTKLAETIVNLLS